MFVKSLLILAILSGSAWAQAIAVPAMSPGIKLLPPSQVQPVLQDRDIYVRAQLDSLSQRKEKHYDVRAVMRLNVSPRQVKDALTRYDVYRELIPFITSAELKKDGKTLDLAGGVFGWMLYSQVRFEEISPELIGFEIIEGNFKGMHGEMRFESLGEYGTLTSFHGVLEGDHFPPAFVIERGAELVFSFTARRMRSYTESHREEKRDQKSEAIPKPRSGLVR